MPEAQKSAVQVMHIPVQEVKHTMKAAHLLYSAPSYVLRGPIYMIFIIAFAALAYSFWGRKDEMVFCPLELRQDMTKVQAPTSGIVHQVYVSEGSVITPLTNLIDIQYKVGAMVRSEADKLQDDLTRIEKEIGWQDQTGADREKRLRDLANTLEEQRANLKLFEERIKREKTDFDTRMANAKREIDQVIKRREQAALVVENARREVSFIQEELEKSERQLKEVNELFAKKQATIMEKDAAETKVNTQRKLFNDAQTKVQQAQNELSSRDLELDRARGEPDRLENLEQAKAQSRNTERTTLLNAISQIEFEIKSGTLQQTRTKKELEEERDRIKKLIADTNKVQGVQYRGDFCSYFSPYGGTISNVYAKGGQQIQVGDVMFNIIKDTEPLYAHILVQNQDIGRIREGQVVQIKYYAFPYQDYGIQTGRIIHIPTRPSDVKGQESMYPVRVSLDSPNIMIRNKPVPLNIGLQGTAEIKVGEKRLIELVFRPISRFFNPID